MCVYVCQFRGNTTRLELEKKSVQPTKRNFSQSANEAPGSLSLIQASERQCLMYMCRYLADILDILLAVALVALCEPLENKLKHMNSSKQMRNSS